MRLETRKQLQNCYANTFQNGIDDKAHNVERKELSSAIFSDYLRKFKFDNCMRIPFPDRKSESLFAAISFFDCKPFFSIRSSLLKKKDSTFHGARKMFLLQLFMGGHSNPYHPKNLVWEKKLESNLRKRINDQKTRAKPDTVQKDGHITRGESK